MDTINVFNSYYCKARFQMDEKPKYTIHVSFVQEHFQHLLTLLNDESLIDREINACPSDRQTMTTARVLTREGMGKAKVFKDRTLVCQGAEAESWRDFSGKRIQET